MVSGFRILAIVPVRSQRKNTSVEPAANRGSPGSLTTPPTRLYIKRGRPRPRPLATQRYLRVVSSLGEPRIISPFHLNRPLFCPARTMADTQVDASSDISAKVGLVPSHFPSCGTTSFRTHSRRFTEVEPEAGGRSVAGRWTGRCEPGFFDYNYYYYYY